MLLTQKLYSDYCRSLVGITDELTIIAIVCDILNFTLLRAEQKILYVVATFPDPIL